VLKHGRRDKGVLLKKARDLPDLHVAPTRRREKLNRDFREDRRHIAGCAKHIQESLPKLAGAQELDFFDRDCTLPVVRSTHHRQGHSRSLDLRRILLRAESCARLTTKAIVKPSAAEPRRRVWWQSIAGGRFLSCKPCAGVRNLRREGTNARNLWLPGWHAACSPYTRGRTPASEE